MSDSYFFTAQPNQAQGIPSYDQLQMRRKLALALAAQKRPYPKTIGEGLTALGEGWADRQMMNRLAEQEAQYNVGTAELLKGITGADPTPPREGGVPAAPIAPAPAQPSVRAEAAPTQTAAAE